MEAAQRAIQTQRKKIDTLDARIVAALCARAAHAAAIGEWKARAGLPIYEPGREGEVVARVQRLRRAPMDEEGLADIFQTIMKTMRRLQTAPDDTGVAAARSRDRESSER